MFAVHGKIMLMKYPLNMMCVVVRVFFNNLQLHSSQHVIRRKRKNPFNSNAIFEQTLWGSN